MVFSLWMFIKYLNTTNALISQKTYPSLVPLNLIKIEVHLIKAIDHTFYSITGLITPSTSWTLEKLINSTPPAWEIFSSSSIIPLRLLVNDENVFYCLSYLLNDYQHRKSTSDHFLSYDGEASAVRTVIKKIQITYEQNYHKNMDI